MAVLQTHTCSPRRPWRLYTALLLATAVVFAARLAAASSVQNAVLPACNSHLTQSEDALRGENFPLALEQAQAALDVCPDKSDPILLQARAHMLQHHFDEAIASLKPLLDGDPHNPSALIVKGQVLFLDNRDADALRAFQDAVHAAPNQAAPHYWLGKFLYQTTQPRQAISEFEAAVHAEPGFFRAYDGLGLAYAALDDNNRSIESFLKAIELTKQEPRRYDDAYGDLAELLLRLGKSSLAFNAAAEAADRNPARSRNFYLAGKAAEDSGNYEASLQWLKRAADLDPPFPDPHFQLARAYRRLGRNDAAMAETALYEKLAADAPKVRR